MHWKLIFVISIAQAGVLLFTPLKRASGPASITVPDLWMRASDSGNFTLDGSDKVTACVDKVSSSNDCVTFATFEPTWVAGVINGKAALRNGVGKALRLGTGTTLDPAQPFAIWIVFKHFQFDTGYPVIVSVKSSTPNNYNVGMSQDGNYADFYLGHGTNSIWAPLKVAVTIDTNFHAVLESYNGADGMTAGNFAFYYDNVSKTISSAGALTTGAGDVGIGADLNSANTGLTGHAQSNTYIAEVRIWKNHEITSGERAILAAYATSEYGL